jgi:hypothetical protein
VISVIITEFVWRDCGKPRETSVIMKYLTSPLRFYKLLQRLIQPLLGNDRETNETTSVARQRPARQLNGCKTVFPTRFAPMAAHAAMATETEER